MSVTRRTKTDKAKYESKSSRAGLQFPVGRFHQLLRKGHHNGRVGASASVYVAAVLEYLAAEVLELAGVAARNHRKSRIIPRHLELAIRNDEDLSQLMIGVTISQGGVISDIQASLLPKKSKSRSNEVSVLQTSKNTLKRNNESTSAIKEQAPAMIAPEIPQHVNCEERQDVTLTEGVICDTPVLQDVMCDTTVLQHCDFVIQDSIPSLQEEISTSSNYHTVSPMSSKSTECSPNIDTPTPPSSCPEVLTPSILAQTPSLHSAPFSPHSLKSPTLSLKNYFKIRKHWKKQ